VTASRALTVEADDLDRLMPLHLQLDSRGIIIHAGPTFRKLTGCHCLLGTSFFEAFELLRPMSVTTFGGLKLHSNVPLKLRLNRHPDLSLRAVAVPGSHGLLVNISFGLSLVEAVRRFDLSNDDFAPTELAIELLYLVEAKTAAYEESRRLNLRLSEARNEAEKQANTDMLTGLKNRRAFVEALDAHAQRQDDFALMHVDLDHFKQVNDQFGHAAGDHVLRHVAEVLAGEVRGSDIVARIGGDEFVLILQNLGDAENVSALSERLIKRLEEPIMFNGSFCRISASIGSTMSTNYDRVDGSCMLRDADAALYRSKREGRGRATHISEAVPTDASEAPALSPEERPVFPLSR